MGLAPTGGKVVSADEAVVIVRSNDTLCLSGFVGIGTPEALLVALERRFLDSAEPKNLTLVFAAAPGDGKERGGNHLAHPGMLKRVIGGHWGLVPKLAQMAVQNQLEAYNFPQGVISNLFREIAGTRAGLLSRIGLHTFVDPRQQGGKLNERTTADLVRLMEIDGDEWLFYPSFPIDVAFIRGTTADPQGNISMEREALLLDNLAIATATKSSGGYVLAQVERLAAPESLSSRQVQVPGVMVDCIVVADPEHHWQTWATPHHPAFSGELRVPLGSLKPLPLDERKVIARRAAMELPPHGVINLGIGMPEGVALVANEEHMLPYITLTAEPGVIGGVPQSGLDFGASVNSQAIIQQSQQFDFYDGGGLDLACLGMAQVDRFGNVNVSYFNSRLAGAGGFINISQRARSLIFAGTFTTGSLKTEIAHGSISIVAEGRSRKFISRVDQITFNGTHAARNGQPVLYVTERCVFELGADGLTLIEVAPGVDIERDILGHMDFEPAVGEPKMMDPRIFLDRRMDLSRPAEYLDFADRLTYDAERNILFLSLDGFSVKSKEDIDTVRREIENRCQAIGKKVSLIANYDRFELDSELTDTYALMIQEMRERYYVRTSSYSTNPFMRLKLGEALKRRNLAPQIFETFEKARSFVAVPPGGQG